MVVEDTEEEAETVKEEVEAPIGGNAEKKIKRNQRSKVTQRKWLATFSKYIWSNTIKDNFKTPLIN